MSRRARQGWRFYKAPAGRNRGQLIDHRSRRLRLERLEERHLLTVTVNTLVDENNGVGNGVISLREAIGIASSGETINFSVSGMISLTSTGGGHLTINKNLTIVGPGASLLTIKAYDPDSNGNNDGDGRRVFLVSNNSSSFLNVTISGLTLTGGDPNEVDEEASVGGGAIRNEENLNINSCVITGNFAAAGGAGAILNSNGILTVTDTIISANEAQDGGGILIDGGELRIVRSRIENNHASNAGGGVLGRSRPLTITDSTVSGNSANEQGGGVYLYRGRLTLTASTISGNVADDDEDAFGSGGGIYNLGGELKIWSSTISGNSGGDDGGGIFSDTTEPVAIYHSTITANSVPSTNVGGGIRSPGTAELDHTIVAGNFRGSTSSRDDISGSFDVRYSLIGDRRTASVDNLGGSLIGTSSSPINAMLGALAQNGGLTRTHLLLSGSPAINRGDPGAMAGEDMIPDYDQRGNPRGRVLQGRIDIGAIEIPPPPPELPGDYNLNESVDVADYVHWRKRVGTSVEPYTSADGNGDGIIDANDYMVWWTNFGKAMPAAASASGEGISNTLASAVPQAIFGTLPSLIPASRPGHGGAIGSAVSFVSPGSGVTDSDSDHALVAWAEAFDAGNQIPDSEPAEVPDVRHNDDGSDDEVESLDAVFTALGAIQG